jgi:hypothetical protein
MGVGAERRFCFDRCKFDYHALKRVQILLAKVGVVRFHELLTRYRAVSDENQFDEFCM